MATNKAIRLNIILIGVIGLLLVTQLSILADLRQVQKAAQQDQSQPVSSATCTATVNVRLLNQRSGPGESYDITGSATRGDGFTVEETGDQWIRVSTSTGPAWMYSRYLTLSGECGQNTTAENAVLSMPATAVPQGQVSESFSETEVPAQVVENSATTALSPAFTAEVQYWADLITAWAAVYQMDANLIATLIQIESCGNPSIHSAAGAQGLFQVMPFHFAAGEDMLDVETNARRGLAYLQGALELAGGDAGLALAGYNGGYGVISQSSSAWFAETRQYYYWGSRIYSEVSSGLTSSPTLQEWLMAGGSGLCSSASESQRLIE